MGGLTFGLTMRYLGIALGYAIALGLCAAFGTLMPPLVGGELGAILARGSGQVVVLGVFVCLLGIAVSGRAGIRKEGEVSDSDKKAVVAEFSLGRGMAVAVACGVMSASMAYGIAAGKPLAEAALAHGAPSLWQNLPVLIVILTGGFLTNFVWCLGLGWKNRTWPEFLGKGSGDQAPLVANGLLCAVAGVTWYLQFFFYGMGTTRMGRYDFSSWTLHMASIIIFSTVWGIALREWRGTSLGTRQLVAAGLALLVASTVIVGYGNYLAAEPAAPSPAADPPGKVTVSWDKVTRVSQTTPTLQVVVNPPLRRGTPVHDNAFQALRDLGADYVRYVPWLPYPRLGVAELDPPRDGKTSWDFSLIDPMTIDFLEATKGHSVILNFSTIPAWMHRTDQPVAYPADPDQVTWAYTQRSEPRDPSFKEIADYYARLLAWYTQGGFTDELGARHESGHRYAISHWEVLNEPDLEYPADPQTYTRLYDAVVEAMRKVSPQTKFVGASLAFPGGNPAFFEYFLNHAHHKPGIPLDFISYHIYAVPSPDESAEVQEHTFFAQAEGFLAVVRYVESIRKRLSPETRTSIDEIGSIAAEDLGQGEPGYVFKPLRSSYWNLAGAMYACIFGQLSQIGVDVAGESQLVGYPTQFPSVSMVDWTDGRPNARFWVLKLLKDSFGRGDRLVETAVDNRYVYAMGAVKPDGKRRLLLVNKRNRPFDLSIPGASGGRVDRVDQATAQGPPASAKLSDERLTLGAFAVAVVTLP